MILLALLLATVGTADLVRPENRAPTRIQAVVAGAAGAVVLVLLTTGLAVGASAWAIIPAVLAFVIGWMLFAPVGIVQTDRPWPVAGLVIAALVALAVPQPAIGDGWLVRWYAGLELPTLADVPVEQFVLGAACVVFLVETANIVVRLMLIGTGPSVLATENTLQGGRILGPIERVFVLGMALAGQYRGAQRRRRGQGNPPLPGDLQGHGRWHASGVRPGRQLRQPRPGSRPRAAVLTLGPCPPRRTQQQAWISSPGAVTSPTAWRRPPRAACCAPSAWATTTGTSPQIGVASSWNEITPCNLSLDRLAKAVKEGVHAAGGYPLEFGTISVSDGIAMGHEGMHFSLVSREVIADSVETVMMAERIDGSVLLAGCDKSLPGMLMAAARLDLASVFLYAGSIMPGSVDGKDVTIIDAFEAVGACMARA